MEGRAIAGKVLVVDDDEASCKLMKAIFVREGFEAVAAHTGQAGIETEALVVPDIVFMDLKLPDMHGLAVLQHLRVRRPHLPVVVLTGHAEYRTAVHATQLGAFDYLTKPINIEEVVVVARRALETGALRVEVEELRRRVAESGVLASQMGHSPEVQQLIERVKVVAASNFSVLVTGETGTGKELVTLAIHRESERRSKPFVALDCGAIPDALLESELFGHEKGAFTGADRRKTGRFQLAQGGTLFLDEIGNLAPALQAKLLRVLESREVQAVGALQATPMDVRFVAATNHDLQNHVAAGRFRADLYFRLAQYTLPLPPLRARASDIPYLAARFLEEAAVELRRAVLSIAPEGVELLQKHRWPGNVRELRNVVRQAVLESNMAVVPSELVAKLLGKEACHPAAVQASVGDRSLKEIAEVAAHQAERQAIGEVLRVTLGNKSQAARLLRTDYKTLHIKMKQLGIRATDFNKATRADLANR
jgi:DNA-binding NtrC family response regulator